MSELAITAAGVRTARELLGRSMRTAAYLPSLERVAAVHRLRGMYA